jgi:hypothetical protein
MEGWPRSGTVQALLALFTLLALVGPFAGAVFDHHFAERFPGHFHTSSRDDIAQHDHAYASAHPHGIQSAGPSGPVARMEEDRGPTSYPFVIVLTGDVGLAPGGFSIPPGILAGPVTDDTPPRTTLVPPLEQPPET